MVEIRQSSLGYLHIHVWHLCVISLSICFCNLKFLLITPPAPSHLGPIARAPPVQVYCPVPPRRPASIGGAVAVAVLYCIGCTGTHAHGRCESYYPSDLRRFGAGPGDRHLRGHNPFWLKLPQICICDNYNFNTSKILAENMCLGAIIQRHFTKK